MYVPKFTFYPEVHTQTPRVHAITFLQGCSCLRHKFQWKLDLSPIHLRTRIYVENINGSFCITERFWQAPENLQGRLRRSTRRL